MCDTEDPKSPELAGLDEDMLMPSGWNHFNLGSQRSQSLRSFPVFQNQRQYNLDHEEIRKKLNQLPAQLTNDRVSQNQSQYNLEYEAILKKLNQLSAQLKDDGDLKGKGQLEVSQLMEQLNKTLSSLCRPCPCDWKFYKDSCYHFSVNRKSWEVAKEMCEAEDSNLVIINSSEEQKYLKQKTSSNQRWWVGLSDKKKEGTWHWVDGTTLTQAFWNEGEPNNAGDEDCCEMISQGWNDAPCSKENYWICEKEASPCANL
ncbi:CD209 antigen isoform X3 [Notamacropus eugenii]|uniref:CD209 antigen isoform X3 n=1 Tax=Notamacropus eugenii TaxID=9315 RepID=UPI003B67B52F